MSTKCYHNIRLALLWKGMSYNWMNDWFVGVDNSIFSSVQVRIYISCIIKNIRKTNTSRKLSCDTTGDNYCNFDSNSFFCLNSFEEEKPTKAWYGAIVMMYDSHTWMWYSTLEIYNCKWYDYLNWTRKLKFLLSIDKITIS